MCASIASRPLAVISDVAYEGRMKLARLSPTSAMTFPITESLLRLGAGLVLGALVGLERESTGRERTCWWRWPRHW